MAPTLLPLLAAAFLLAATTTPAAAAASHSLEELRMREAVSTAMDTVHRVLGAARHPVVPSDAAHTYDDKYALVELQIGNAAAATLHALEVAGASPSALATMARWAAGGQAVTLRLSHVAGTRLVSKAERREEGPALETVNTNFLGMESTTATRVVHTVVDYEWASSRNWTLTAFAGAHDDGAASDTLTLRTSSVTNTINTTTPVMPERELVVSPPVDLTLTWLLQQLVPIPSQSNPSALAVRFAVNRTQPTCHTPRRNADVEAALAFGSAVARILAAAAPLLLVDPSAIPRVDNVFLPPALFESTTPTAASDGDGHHEPDGLLARPANGTYASSLVNVTAANLLLEEGRRLLLAECARVTASVSSAAVAEEACTALALRYASLAWRRAAEGVQYVEAMLRDQLTAAVGKVLQPSDFGEYMVYHNARAFRPEYVPRPFVYSVRRSPTASPEGVLRIDDAASGNPIATFQALRRTASANATISFALNAQTHVQVGGDVYVHAWLGHRFASQLGDGLRLTASARAFASFIVLVGRITGPATFAPAWGAIVKDRDELSIPLALSQLPSPAAFADAITSLSPQQRRFATALRAAQLQSSLVGVLVLAIKPQLEVLLRLPPDALTREIGLTRDLTELFIKHQIPADLLAYDGPDTADARTRLAAVKEHVGSIQVAVAAAEAASKKSEEAPRPPPAVPARESRTLEIPVGSGASTGTAARTSVRLASGHSSGTNGGDTLTLCSGHSSGTYGSAGVEVRSGHIIDSSGAYGSGGVAVGSAAAPCHGSDCGGGGVTVSHPADVTPPVPNSTPVPQQQLTDLPTKEEPASDTHNNNELPAAAVGHPSGADGDLTALPDTLDATYLRHDARAALRSTIITPSSPWTLRRAAGTTTLGAGEQAASLAATFDLLDALTRSGALPLPHGQLHVILGATHAFVDTLLNTLVVGNMNPIEEVERSQLIIASTLHGVPPADLLTPAHAARLAATNPDLLAGLAH